jgi:hypothetical protein
MARKKQHTSPVGTLYAPPDTSSTESGARVTAAIGSPAPSSHIGALPITKTFLLGQGGPQITNLLTGKQSCLQGGDRTGSRSAA